MANEIFTRIQLKYDSYDNWTAANTPLLEGEIAVAYLGVTHTTTSPDNGTHPVLFKVGPGNFNALPWASALAADVYGWAKKEHLDLADLPDIPVEDTESGKFVTDVEWDTANNKVIIHRGNVEWDDIQKKPNLVNSVKTTDDDVVILTPETAQSGDVTITGAHKKYNGAGATTGQNQEIGANGTEYTIQVPDLTVDEYGHTVFNGEISHTITIPAPVDPIVPGAGDITIEAGAGLAEGGSFNVDQDDDKTITLKHADTSNVANVSAADRTYVKSLTFDDFGHVTAVGVGTETVENTAHTHANGAGTKVEGNGGVEGEVKVNLNVAFELVDKTIRLYDKDDATKTALATLDATDFIKDGMLDDVSYNADTNELTFTWNTEAGSKTDVVTLTDILDPYSFKEGALIDITEDGLNITIAHETVAAPTEAAGTGRKYLTGVTTDGYGHITGFTTAIEVDDGILEVTASGDDEITLEATEENGVVTITAAHELHAEGEAKTASTATINGYGATGTIKIPKLVTNEAGHVIEIAEETVAITMPAEQTLPDIPGVDGSAVIASISNNIVTLKAGALLKEENGDHVLANDNGEDITLAKIAKTGSIYDVAEGAHESAEGAEDAGQKYLIFNCGSATKVI